MVIERGRAYLQRVVDRLVGPSLDQEPPIDALTESEQYRMDALVTYIYDNTEGNIAVLRKRADLARHVYRLRPGIVELHITGRDVGLSTKEQERMSGLLRDFIAREGIEAQEFPTTTDQIRVYDMSPEGWGLIKFPNVVLPNPHFVLAGGEGTRPFLIDILSRSLQEDVDHLGSLSSPAEVIGRTQ